MRSFTLILIGILHLAANVKALPSQKDFEYGLRPALSVFDPNGFLAPEVLKEISDPLEKMFNDEGIDIFVIILKDLKGAPPEHVARSFARAWCDSAIQSIVLHVPGQPGSPWIVPAGKITKVISPAEISLAVASAHQRAALEGEEHGKVRVAAAETSRMLRHWMNDIIERAEAKRTDLSKADARRKSRADLLKVGLFIGICLLIPLCGIIFSIFQKMEKRRPSYFPTREHPRRLGAPYAGGNHAVVKLGPPPPAA